MSAMTLSSKVSFYESEPHLRGIPTRSTSVVGAIGITERGPVGVPVLCQSFKEYVSRFGGFTQNADLSLSALGFFENGGRNLWVTRTVHYEDITDADSLTARRAFGFLTGPGGPAPAVLESAVAFPLRLEPNDAMVLSVRGGPDENILFLASAASISSQAEAPFAIEDGLEMRVRIDGGAEQSIVFSVDRFQDINAVTPEEVAAVINTSLRGGRAKVEEGRLVLESDTRGRRSSIEVIGEDARALFGFQEGEVRGGGNVEDITQVSFEELQAHVEERLDTVRVLLTEQNTFFIQTVLEGGGASLEARQGTSERFLLAPGLHQGSDEAPQNLVRIEGKDPGSYANHIQVQIGQATNGEEGFFDLRVVEDGRIEETFVNLTLNPEHDRHIDRIINDEGRGSGLIRSIDLEVDAPPPLLPQRQALLQGSDGLEELDDVDFLGSEASKTGLNAFDTVLDLTLLMIPGLATPAIHQGMIRYCEVERKQTVFAILDPPSRQSATDIVRYVSQTASIEGLSEYAAIYWPRVNILNPDKNVFGNTKHVTVPPSGIIAGVYARTDGSRPGGVYDQPAGIEQGKMFGVLGFETDEVLEERKRDLVYPKRINPLTTAPGLPKFIDGSRTLKANGNFPSIAERRGVMFIERSLQEGLQFTKHKNHDERLRAQVKRTITAFLLLQMNQGAFRSQDPEKAFFVDVSETLNTPAVVFANQLLARVGLATQKPAEFIFLEFSSDTRSLEEALSS